MTADKRSVSTDALETLGTIIDENQKRDAIHLAVLPTIAAQTLSPGDHVNDKGELVKEYTGIGIVDPFLRVNVNVGERFWLVIYPRMINSLRHVWTLPGLPDELGVTGNLFPGYNLTESEAWLRDFCGNADCPGYDAVMAVIQGDHTAGMEDEDGDGVYGYIEDGRLHFGGRDASGEIPDEFWDHVEVVLGRKIPGHDRASYFSCSC